MITGEHSVIRMAEADDAYELKRLYDAPAPRSALLDRRREMPTMSVDEVREGLARHERFGGILYAIEDKGGFVRGFCTLRGVQVEMSYGEVVMMLFEEADYDNPLADEAYDYLHHMAFDNKRLNKVVAHCLDNEQGYRRLLVRKGFQSNGVQREVLWTQGRWHSIEMLTRFHDDRKL
jgi:RimJ/RimL family protein N-acetyltransferase